MEDISLENEQTRPQVIETGRATEPSTTPQYKYSPFENSHAQKQIRLLTLLSSCDDENAPIECSLRIVLLDENTEYEALSYCWGDAKDKISIYLKQPEGLFTTLVNRNLHAALRHLRLPDKPRSLWIDALCINQEDMIERNQQVAMMRHIYRSAAHTVIWLGEATPESGSVIDLFSMINQSAMIGNSLGVRPNLVSLNLADRLGLPIFTDPIWSHLCEFFTRHWFYRIWIIQELALSKTATILCGKRSFPWDAMAAACRYAVLCGLCRTVQGQNSDALAHCVALIAQRDGFQRMEPRTIMYVLLRNASDARATDPRDYLFAFNGLFEPESFDEIATRPDYLLDYAGLYTKFAIDLMRQHQSLDILSIPSPTRELHAGKLPSWVPDWSDEESGQIGCLLVGFHNLNMSAHLRPNYKASGDSIFQPQLDESGKKLLLTGYVVDSVEEISAVIGFDRESQPKKRSNQMGIILLESFIQHARVMRSAHNVALSPSLNKKYPTGEEPVDAFWQTLCAGNAKSEFAASKAAFRVLQRRYRPMRPLQLLHLDHIWFLVPIFYCCTVLITLCCCGLRWARWIMPKNDPTTIQFALDIAVSNYRRVIKTRAGLIGIASGTIKKGDFVTICNGGKVPILLRAWGDEFKVVGDAYVHGLTDGNVWAMLKGTAEQHGGMWDAIKSNIQHREFWVS